jgi:hypothetical protein
MRKVLQDTKSQVMELGKLGDLVNEGLHFSGYCFSGQLL